MKKKIEVLRRLSEKLALLDAAREISAEAGFYTEDEEEYVITGLDYDKLREIGENVDKANDILTESVESLYSWINKLEKIVVGQR
jgi:ribosomal protein L13E